MRNISIRWQLVIICVLLVTIPIIIFGIYSFNSSKKSILTNIEETLRIQCVDWSIITQSYYDVIKENKRAAMDTTESLIASQASGVLKLVENHLSEDLTALTLKEPVLRVRESVENMLKSFFYIDEFKIYIGQFDNAIDNMKKMMEEANTKKIDTELASAVLTEFLEEVKPLRSRLATDPSKLAVQDLSAAEDALEREFSDLAEKLSDERLKESLASTVIGKTGYVYIIDYKGNYVLSKHREGDGENIWYVEDDKGGFIVQDIVTKAKVLKKGESDYYTYSWRESEGEKYREQLAAIMHFPEKEWIVGAVINKDELLESDFEEIKKEELKNLMASQSLGKTGHLAIVGSEGEYKGKYILSDDRKYDGENALWKVDSEGKSFIEDIIEDSQKLGENESRVRYYTWREAGERVERQKVMAYTYFKPWGWVIIASAYLDEFLEDIRKIKNQILLISIIAILLGSSIVYIFANTMTHTICTIVGKMNKVAGGNLDVEMDDIRVLGDENEIGQLAGAFKKMTDDLCQTTFSKDYVNNIIDNMNDALFVIDKELRIVTINRATSLLIKYTESEILKYSIKDFLISEESGAKIFKEKIFNGEGIENLELTLQDKEGSSIPVSISGSPLKDADGKVIRVVLIARDISEHKRLLSELSEARSELEEKVKKLEKSDRAMLFMVEDLNKTTEDLKVARNKLEEKIIEVEKVNKELDDFTYIVSHDLKEPLRGIKAFTKMLSEDYSGKVDKEGKEYLSNISDSSVRMARLIEDLLNLSRIGRIRNIEPGVDLNEALSDVRKNLAYSLEEKNVDLKIGKDFPKITCDKIRISEVFSNLISNAIKYSKKDARPIVEVGYSKKGDFYEFYVKDNGIGIEEGYYDKIFQIFQRLHGKGEYEGTGAGLTIVKKIIESHNGKVWVESKVGEGSIFYFTLPVSQEKMITEI